MGTQSKTLTAHDLDISTGLSGWTISDRQREILAELTMLLWSAPAPAFAQVMLFVVPDGDDAVLDPHGHRHNWKAFVECYAWHFLCRYIYVRIGPTDATCARIHSEQGGGSQLDEKCAGLP